MHRAALHAKRKHVEDQIVALEQMARVVTRIGGRQASPRADEIAFQQQRLAWIDDLGALTDDQIRDRLAAIVEALGAEAEAIETGDVRGLTPEDIARVCEAGLCRLALQE